MTNSPYDKKPLFNWAIPAELGIPPDPIRLRLDFHHQAVELTDFEGDTVTTKVVSAHDIAEALANEISFNSGLLPENTLWWRNSRSGSIIALYEKPRTRKVALQEDINKPAQRFTIPLPGLVFLCSPGRPPWVYAVKKKPTKETDRIFKAPLLNVFANGLTCPGSHHYPERVADVVESFFVSFFSNTADLANRSKRFPNSVVQLWKFLDKKTSYPCEDLVEHGSIKDLLKMEMR